MLNNVIWKLRTFLAFYVILVVLFSLMQGVIGTGNYKLDGGFRTAFDKNNGRKGTKFELKDDFPGIEYK